MFGMSAAYISYIDQYRKQGFKPPPVESRKLIRYCVVDVFATQSFYNRVRFKEFASRTK